MIRADAHNWLKARGITPSLTTAVATAARYQWTVAANKGPLAESLRKELEVLGYALDWGVAPATDEALEV